MSISPLETRYRTEMSVLFDDEYKMRTWLRVEVALAKAHATLGHIPPFAAHAIEQASGRVTLSRVQEIEAEIHHDLMALVRALTEQCPPEAGKYVHLGATSYDIEDTAFALVMKDAFALIEKHLRAVAEKLRILALEKKDLVCVGRTHGQHAVPTTYGLKFAIYYDEMLRHLERIQEGKKRWLVGKMTGAVGTMATFGDDAFALQDLVMKELGLTAARTSNQIIQRDVHAEALFVLALIAATIEKIAKEIRNLQRNEIMEVAEPFKKKSQVGSSTMPQKRNPHRSERLCSLARVVRANLGVALENIPLEHERDLTNSANERYIFPEAFITTDYMLVELYEILSGLEFFPENIARNLAMSEILSERVMLALVQKGMGRQEAHELLRKKNVEAREKGKRLKDLLHDFFSPSELEYLFDPTTYTGKAKEIVDRVCGTPLPPS